MKKKISIIGSQYRGITVLSKDTNLEGNLKFDTSVEILGKFKGNIETSGTLYLAEDSEVFANINANNVHLAGFFKGEIIASDTIEMQASGKIFGKVITKKLKIEDGVIFEGKCEMNND